MSRRNWQPPKSFPDERVSFKLFKTRAKVFKPRCAERISLALELGVCVRVYPGIAKASARGPGSEVRHLVASATSLITSPGIPIEPGG